MLIITKRRYKKQRTIGGAGMFDSVAKFLTRMFTSNAAKQLASTALDVGKSAAVNVSKHAATEAGKKLVNKILTPKSQEILNKYTSNTSNAKEAENLDNLLMGSGRAIAIQALVKRLNGSGLKVI